MSCRHRTKMIGSDFRLDLLLLFPLVLLMIDDFGQIKIASCARNEYCIEEKLEAQCSADEILVIESARYGRMRLNRCVKTDYGYIGCGADVTTLLASKCSGRRQCRIVNIEALFSTHITDICPPDLKSYLEASFTCIKVVIPPTAPSKSRCIGRPSPGGAIGATETRGPSGVLASLTAYELGVGTTSCPWLIVAARGQRVNLTLMDFVEQYNVVTTSSGSPEAGARMLTGLPNDVGGSMFADESPLLVDERHLHQSSSSGGRIKRKIVVKREPGSGPRYCREYATVVEDGETPGGGTPTTANSHTLVVCSGDGARYHAAAAAAAGGQPQQSHRVVYTSTTNRLRVTFTTPMASAAEGIQHEGPYFALKYDIVGCPYPNLPSNAHVMPSSDTASDVIKIQCNGSSDWWTLQCVGETWSGTSGNCTDSDLQPVASDIDNYLPYGLSLLVIIVVALLICTLTLSVGLAYMHRHRLRSGVSVSRSRSSLGSSVKHRPMATSSAYALAPTATTIGGTGVAAMLHQHQPSRGVAIDDSGVVLTTTAIGPPGSPSLNASPVKSNTLPTRLGPHSVSAGTGCMPATTTLQQIGSCSSPTHRRVIVNFSPTPERRCCATTEDFDDVILMTSSPPPEAAMWQRRTCWGKCTCTGGNRHQCVHHAAAADDVLTATRPPGVACLHQAAIAELPPPPPPAPSLMTSFGHSHVTPHAPVASTMRGPQTALLFTTFRPVPPLDPSDCEHSSSGQNGSLCQPQTVLPSSGSVKVHAGLNKLRLNAEALKPR